MHAGVSNALGWLQVGGIAQAHANIKSYGLKNLKSEAQQLHQVGQGEKWTGWWEACTR